MNIKEIFFELSHEKRYQIFRLINIQNINHSDIKVKLNLVGSEVTRHTQRLIEASLIQRNLKGIYQKTNFGRIINEILDYFEFSVKNYDFINEHNINAIPTQLMSEIGKLVEAKVLNRTMENIEKWAEMIINANEFIWSISDQLQNSIIPIVQRKINDENLKIRAILEKSLLDRFINDDSWERYLTALKPEIIEKFFEKLEISQNVRVKENLGLALTITESETILFLSTDRGVDYSQCIYANNDEYFLKWAKELFLYYWKDSEFITIEELSEIGG